MPQESSSEFNGSERSALAPYVTNLDGPVFALINLPETVKGALFARYSRSSKSLRRLLLDEFLDKSEAGPSAEGAPVGVARADRLYERVFNEFGDDSVAQLGGAHLACEGASNILTKVLEWGRLMSYLEQSTRYIPYTAKQDGRWRYVIPPELEDHPLRTRYVEVLDDAFETYSRWIEPAQDYFRRAVPQAPDEVDSVYKRAIRAKTLDTLRGLLPAATQSSVGLFGSGQAYEALLLRMRAHPLAEVRHYGDLMLVELRKVIPAFLTRVDQPHRGERWSRYFEETNQATAAIARRVLADQPKEDRPEVTLTDFDPDGELKVVAAALYSVSELPDDQLLDAARRMSPEERGAVLNAYVGDRSNRRHKPGRAFERTSYRFDLLTDYGAFRDLQRHRLLTIEWQTLGASHGFGTPAEIGEIGAGRDWERIMEASAELHSALDEADLGLVAPYAVCFAYRIRFYMEMNAREAMHMIELRTTPQGHPSYRRVCQEMHRLIRDQAGHASIAAAMSYVDYSEIGLERLESERATERRRRSPVSVVRGPDS